MQQIIKSLFYFKPRIKFQFQAEKIAVEIETQHFYIRSYSDSDFEKCISLYGDSEITKYFDYGQPLSRDEVYQLVRQKGKRYFSKGEPFGLFSIFDKQTGKFIGQCDLIPIYSSGIVEIGCILHKELQHQGFGTEVVKALVFDYIKALNNSNLKSKFLPIRKIIATVHPNNTVSNKLIQHLGMRFDKFKRRFNNPRFWYSYMIPSIASSKKIRKIGA